MPIDLIIKILLAIVILFILIIGFGAWIIADRIIRPPKSDYKSLSADLKRRLNFSETEFEELMAHPYEEVSIPSNYGYLIKGRLFDQASDKSVILLHREGRNLMASYKFLEMYIDQGYNILMCDARYHGLTGGDNYTYGYFERWDLLNQADFMFERYGTGSMLGFHGESGGAATALMALDRNENISFTIADSSFTELLEVMRSLEEKVLRTRSKRLLILINQIVKRRAGFSLADVNPLYEIEALEVPVFFIHSERDTIIPAKMSKILTSFKSGYNELYIIPNSLHLMGYYQHREEYESRVQAFLDNTEALYSQFGKTVI